MSQVRASRVWDGPVAWPLGGTRGAGRQLSPGQRGMSGVLRDLGTKHGLEMCWEGRMVDSGGREVGTDLEGQAVAGAGVEFGRRGRAGCHSSSLRHRLRCGRAGRVMDASPVPGSQCQPMRLLPLRKGVREQLPTDAAAASEPPLPADPRPMGRAPYERRNAASVSSRQSLRRVQTRPWTEHTRDP